jgi:hypothetical protein
MPPKAPRRAGPAAESPAAPVLPEPPPESTTPAAAPDWRSEMEIAANNQIENEARKARQPSVLAPHDFSKVKPGSTDDARRKFGWSHAATHRVEEIPTGGLLININDRCAVVWAVLPLALCRIGKIPARGDLFDHMKDSAPEAYP